LQLAAGTRPPLRSSAICLGNRRFANSNSAVLLRDEAHTAHRSRAYPTPVNPNRILSLAARRFFDAAIGAAEDCIGRPCFPVLVPLTGILTPN
ncbi:MAG TPA: hypothetical protein VN673_02140, partial [Clostridia bacterium]|nr:hypothetical protein [Clostridia bacterium]